MFFPNFALFLLFNAQNEVLLARRINTPFCAGCYSLPGGQIAYGETARQTVVREARDSLGLSIDIDKLQFKHIVYRKCNDPEFFACVFTAQLPADYQPVNGEPERHDQLAWFAIDNLPEQMVPAHRHVIEQVAAGVMYSEHGWEMSCS